MVRWALRCGKDPWKLERTSKHTWNQPFSREGSPKGPYKWKKGDFVFVNSLSDFFHADAPDEWRAEALHVMAKRKDLIFLVLTKRPENMVPYFEANGWPALNVWLGVTAENQERWDERVPYLARIKASGRMTFVSAEPLVGPIDLTDMTSDYEQLAYNANWIIVGGESGPGCRTMRLGWAEDIMYHCRDMGIAYFLKQLGGNPDKRERMEEWPEELRVREFPFPEEA